MPVFWRRASPNPNGTFSSGKTLVDLSGTIQLDRSAERGAHSRYCLPPSDGITTWSGGGRLTAYIYHRSCLIRLGSLYPIALRRKALAAHSVRNLITRWCDLNKPKPLKTGEWTIRRESMRKFRQHIMLFVHFQFGDLLREKSMESTTQKIWETRKIAKISCEVKLAAGLCQLGRASLSTPSTLQKYVFWGLQLRDVH